MKPKTLTTADRTFLSLVSEAAFANPFSPHRAELNRKISGRKSPAPRHIILPEVIREVAARLKKLDKPTPAKILHFQPPDRDLIKYVFLFDVYHQFMQPFDQLIIDQVAADSEPIKVPFAQKALAALANRGFTAAEANRYFAQLYQLRRAFYFIDHGLIGQSPSMQTLRMNLWNNIFTYDILHFETYLWDKMEDFSTLLLGPTGCGKGAAAAAIGKSGFIPFDPQKRTFAKSFTTTFVPINLSQFAESLLESELFGHTKGAFTGAVASHDGLFALCGSHGSIFLDEIGEISQQVQIKLLKVLEERTFSPVGSHQQLHFHGRVIAATNQSIENIRSQGKFRDDFYYRLCSDCILVPSLSRRIAENPNELTELIAHSIKLITGSESSHLAKIVADVIKKRLPKDYPWPGNVRELAQCVRRVIIKRDYTPETTTADHSREANLTAEISAGTVTSEDLINHYCAYLYDKYQTYQKVAEITKLDRRTVKKHIKNYAKKRQV
jgi:DNA-binding NtrC family response regulator